MKLVTHCFGSIMGGSLFGNLCSPIADTSILTVLATKVRAPRSRLSRRARAPSPLSAPGAPPRSPLYSTLFCQVDLGAHIATAAPYVVGVGLLSLLLGDLPVGLGVMSPAAALAAQARALPAARRAISSCPFLTPRVPRIQVLVIVGSLRLFGKKPPQK